MTEERTPFNIEIRKDIGNFEQSLEAELGFLINKYNPSDFDVRINRADPGRCARVSVTMSFE